MRALLLFAVRLALVSGGLLCLYAAFFLYETDEGKIQNRLEEWWIRLDDWKNVAVRREVLFLQRAAVLVESGLSGLFGDRLFSMRAFSISVLLSFSSAVGFSGLVVGSVVFFWGNDRPGGLPWLDLTVVWLFGAAVLAVLVRACFAPRFERLAPSLVAGMFAAPVLAAIVESYIGPTIVVLARMELESAPSSIVALLAGLVVSALCDFSAVSMSRQLLRWIVSSASGWRLLASGVLTAVMTMGFTLGLLLVGLELAGSDPHFMNVPIAFAILVAALSNVGTGLALLLFLSVATLLLAHRLLWGFIQRPIYAAHRHGLIKHHKIVATLGVVLISLAWPTVGEQVGALFKPFGVGK